MPLSQYNNGVMFVGFSFVTLMMATEVKEQHATSVSCGYVGGSETES